MELPTYLQRFSELQQKPRNWIVTGAAGFIGSHLVEALLRLGQSVTGIDNLVTGSLANILAVKKLVGPDSAKKLNFIEGDINDPQALGLVFESATAETLVLHQAALGSVPRSIAEPDKSHQANVNGFMQVVELARKRTVKRLVYASSSSVYGDEPNLPKCEDRIGSVLSPYAATKRMNEVWAQGLSRTFPIELVGLRYFNIFGPRQSPAGPYAAVIPLWIEAFSKGQAPQIYGDGETSRDFCYVANAVQANLLAALAPASSVKGLIFNVAVSEQTSLLALLELIRLAVGKKIGREIVVQPLKKDFRLGDVRHSLANIGLAEKVLGYKPTHRVAEGIEATVNA